MRTILSLLFVLVAATPQADPIGSQPRQGKLRVLITTGGHDFEEKAFYAMFDGLKDVEYTKAPLPKSAGLLKPGLEKQYDVIVMYDMVPKISPDEQKAFAALLERGIGVVALHHNLGAHRDWDEFRRVIGGKYCFGVSQFQDGKLRIVADEIDGKKYGPSTYKHDQDLDVKVADRDHPITRGMDDFTIHDETYKSVYVSPEAHVLLTVDHPHNDAAIAWVKRYGKCRVFYFQLGHDAQAWKNPAYPEVLGRAIRWTAGR